MSEDGPLNHRIEGLPGLAAEDGLTSITRRSPGHQRMRVAGGRTSATHQAVPAPPEVTRAAHQTHTHNPKKGMHQWL